MTLFVSSRRSLVREGTFPVWKFGKKFWRMTESNGSVFETGRKSNRKSAHRDTSAVLRFRHDRSVAVAAPISGVWKRRTSQLDRPSPPSVQSSPFFDVGSHYTQEQILRSASRRSGLVDELMIRREQHSNGRFRLLSTIHANLPHTHTHTHTLSGSRSHFFAHSSPPRQGTGRLTRSPSMSSRSHARAHSFTLSYFR